MHKLGADIVPPQFDFMNDYKYNCGVSYFKIKVSLKTKK